MNELLGGGGCRCKWHLGALAERRSGKARTRTRELTAGCNRSDRASHGTLAVTNHRFRSRPTHRMRCVSAPNGLDRRRNAAGSRPKSSANRSRQSQRVEKQSNQTLFCRLTPELSRADLRPWASEDYRDLYEAAKRSRLGRNVSAVRSHSGSDRSPDCILAVETGVRSGPAAAFPENQCLEKVKNC